MINGGSMSLNQNDFNNLYFINNQSYLNRNLSPIMKIDTNPYDYNINNEFFNNSKYRNQNLNKKSNLINTRYPSYKAYFNNSNNYYLPSSQQFFNPDNNNNSQFISSASKNNEEKIIMNKIQKIFNESEKKKEQKILHDYYKQNYKEMLNKNIDNYPNGINLSISNCETQYPITKLNSDDNFVKKLKIFLDNYEKNNHSKKKNKNIKNHISNSLTSYEFYSKNVKKNHENKNMNKTKYLDTSKGKISNTCRHQNNNSNQHLNQNYSNKKNSLNESNVKFYKEFNKTCDNFNNKKKANNLLKEIIKKKSRNNFDMSENRNYSVQSIGEFFEKNNENLSSSRIKLLSIENKHKEFKTVFKRFSKKNRNEIIGKNLSKEYELQEKYISKMKLFIDYIESFYIMSLNKFFRYFIKSLQTYNLLNITKNKDCEKLLKRYQKTRNIHNNFNNNISYNSNNNNTTYRSKCNLNRINIIENYKTKDNSSRIKSNVNPEIYIPKNKIEHIKLSKNNISNNLSSNKIKNNVISSKFLYNKNIETTDNKNVLSTDYKSKNMQSTQEKKNLVKPNINKNNYGIIKKNIHLKNISSFDINDAKINTFDEFNNNFIDKNNSKVKPIIYLKPKSRAQNLKKMIISKDKNSEKISNTNSKTLYNKKAMNNTMNINNNLNYMTNQNISKPSTSFQNSDSFVSPIKSRYPSKIDNYKKIYNIKKSNEHIISKNIAEELVIKHLNTHDKRLWVTIKYITSELSIQKFSKMKIRRRLVNLSNNKNIFLNNELKLLKPFHNDSLEIISPLSLVKTQMKSNHKISIIPEEKEDINNSSKISDMIKIIQKYVKKNIRDFQKRFFEYLKEKYNLSIISLSQRKAFKMIKNNFKNINDIDINKISNHILEDNDEIEEKNISDNENITNSKQLLKKNEHCKRNLFPDISLPSFNTEDNIFNYEKINYLNKSELCEKSDFSDTANGGEKNLNFSGIFERPKKRPFRLKITKYKIFREIISQNKKIKIKKDIIKEDEEMRKKNKIIYLLTDKFSDYNNGLRTIKNYFNIWKENIINNNKIKCNEQDIINDVDEKLNEHKEERKNDNEEEDDDESNIDNLDSKDEGIIKINDLIKNRSDILYNPSLNELSKINNQKGIEINSIRDSEENKSFQYDKNELEDKIHYFRIYLINYYAFKRKNIGTSEEEKED